jgi:MATE family multidrug resistance protein
MASAAQSARLVGPAANKLEELGAVVRLAAPIVAIQVGMMLMGTVDSMMLGRLSQEALAAGALGNTISFGLLVPVMGLIFALDPLIAQAWGAGEREQVARHFQRGLVLAAVLSLPLSLIMWYAEPILVLLRQNPAVIPEAKDYLRGLIAGNLPFLFFIVLRQSLTAMGQLAQAVWAILIANVANVGANWLLIFGHWGFPELGVIGSAYATAFSRWLMVAVIFLLSLPTLRPLLGRIGTELWRRDAYWGVARIGLPIAVLLSLEMWLFSAVALIMGSLGARELASHQIALNLAALSFQVPVGIAGAAAARVGNAIGRRDAVGARRSARVCLGMGAGVMTVSAAAFAFLPGQLARFYTPDQEVIALAATLIPIAALFQVFDGVQVVGSGVLRGAADTRVPALLGLIGYWCIGLPLGYQLAFRWGHGPQGLWWGLTIALAAVAAMLVARITWRFNRSVDRVEVG